MSKCRSLSKKTLVVIGLLLLVSVGGGVVFTDWWVVRPEGRAPQYVGRESCIRCHTVEASAFEGSHHDLAMDLATEDTVLGDFADQTIEHHGIQSTMFRDGKRFMVHTEGPDGEMADFEVKYVFGYEPLQQYMVEFDRPDDMPSNEIARVQVLRISWDTEQNRWFHLDPPDVADKLDPDDPLHWTGSTQCWNTSCADCHSTNLRKNFDPESGLFHTTFSEIDVSCEACHGPGSDHVEMAEALVSRRSLFWDRKIGYGLAKLKTQSNINQIETCAPCHSRRRVLKDGYHAGERFGDYFACELIGEHTYHADGQILDEVYVYGSFLQSKMFHQNIRCTDCHDPHTARLKHQGNKLCTSCHQHPANEYDSPAHHHHQSDSPGASCVECHMPSTVYMEVDPRRDHSLRIPRPDLSVEYGTPNACSACHVDVGVLPIESQAKIKQYQDWLRVGREGDETVQAELDKIDQAMLDAVQQWYGDTEFDPSPAPALLSARRNDPDAVELLGQWIDDRKRPAILRATAALELARFDSRESYEFALQALEDGDAGVVMSALARIEVYIDRIRSQASTLQIPDPQSFAALFVNVVEEVAPKLRHENIGVRIEAARVLTAVPGDTRRELFNQSDREAFDAAITELENSLKTSNDRGMAYVALGNVYEALDRVDDAEQAYRDGLRIDPYTTGPRTHLAEILERRGEALINEARQALTQRQDDEYERLSNEAKDLMFEVAVLRAQEIELLAKDAARLPDAAAIQYRYGLALHVQGRAEEAQAALEKAYALEPQQPQYVLALALLYERRAQWREAIRLSQELIELVPDNPSFQLLLERIERGQATGRPRE